LEHAKPLLPVLFGWSGLMVGTLARLLFAVGVCSSELFPHQGFL